MLRYDDTGSGLPVVLIHGFPLCRKMWAPQVEFLSAAGFRVICPDLPGFGESPLPEEPITMQTYADAVIALLDQLGFERAVVAGMSMGGYVLFDLAERYRRRLLGAIFVVTRAASDDEAAKEKRTLLAAEVAAGNHQLVPDTFAKVLFAPQTSEYRPQLVTQVRQWMAAASASGIVGGLLAMRDRADSRAALQTIDLPSLVIGADQDLAIPWQQAQLLAEALPDAELTIITGAGHMANLEEPEPFNKAILDFLARFSGIS